MFWDQEELSTHKTYLATPFTAQMNNTDSKIFVEVPADTLIGEEGQGFKIVRRKRGLATDAWRLTTARFFTE